MDLALEVPDTPERPTVQRAEQAFNGNIPREMSYSSRRNFRSSDEIDSETLFLKGRIASSISSSSYSRIPHPTRCRTARRRTVEDSNVVHLIDSAENQGNELSSNGNGIMSTDMSSKHQRSSSQDKGKGISVAHERPNKIEPKNFGQRRLVRNGLISPLNIAKSSDVGKVNARQNDQDVNNRASQPSSQFPRHAFVVDSLDHESTSGRSLRGKRKPSPNAPSLGESSSSRNLERSIIDVDELPSPVSRNGVNFDSNQTAQQVMSDELYARQLQEEFFRESSLFDEVWSSVSYRLSLVFLSHECCAGFNEFRLILVLQWCCSKRRIMCIPLISGVGISLSV